MTKTPLGTYFRRDWIFSVIFSIALSTGILEFYTRIMHFSLPQHAILTCSIVVATLICGLIGRGRKFGKYSALISLVFTAILWLIFGIMPMINGFLTFVNTGITWWNDKYQSAVMLLPARSVTAQTMMQFSILVCFLISSLSWQLVSRKHEIGIEILLVCLALSGLLLDRFSSGGTVGILISLVALVLFKNHSTAYARKILWFSAIAFSLLILTVHPGNSTMGFVKQFHETTKTTVNKIRYGEDTLPQGDLYKSSQMLDGHSQTLRVTTAESKTLYLRGFQGAQYQNGKWLPLPKAAFGNEYHGMLKWLKDQEFSPATQYQSYLKADKTNSFLSNNISIKNVGARRNYVYAPYSVEDINAKTCLDTGFYSRHFFGSIQYQITERSDSIPMEISHTNDWVLSPQTNPQKQYMRAETVYRNFVYDHYLTMDSDMKALIRSYFIEDYQDSMPNGIYAITTHIRSILKNQVTYQKIPDKVPESEEPISWFLTEGHVGNAALFASTAVEAYRAFGIPTRYVEGYLVREKLLNHAVDNTVTLTNQDSHAWVEVYMDGIGWVPIDVTPGFYYNSYTLMQILQNPNGQQKDAMIDRNDHLTNELKRDVGTKNESNNKPPAAYQIVYGLLGTFVMLLIILTILMSIWVVVALYRHKRLIKYLKEDHCTEWCIWIRDMLLALDIPTYLGWQSEEIDHILCQRFSNITPGEYMRVAGLMEKYFYGGEPLMPHERRVLTGFIQKIYSQKLKLRYRIRLLILWMQSHQKSPKAFKKTTHENLS